MVERMDLPDIYRGGFGALAPPAMAGGATSDRFDLRSLITIFRRRLLLFTLVVANCTLLAVLVTLAWPPSYTATANVVLTTESEVTPSPDQAQQRADNTERTETNWQTIESRGVAEKVFAELKLDRDADFVSKVTTPGTVQRLLSAIIPIKPLDAQTIRALLITRMLNSLTVSRLGNSYVLEIDYSDSDPTRAAAIANAFASQLAAYQVSIKQQENERAIAVLKARVEQLRVAAQNDFAAVQNFRNSRNLLSTNLAGLTEQELANYNQQVASARAEASEANAKLAAAQGQLAEGKQDVGAAQSSPVVQSLRSQRAQLSAKVADLSARYLDDYPDLQQARRQLADIDQQIAVEVRRSLTGLQADAHATGERLGSLVSSERELRRTLAQNNASLIPLDDLMRKAQTSQALYETYLDRYKQAATRAGAEKADSQVISTAPVPTRPSSPILWLNLALGFGVGVLLGAVLALVLETSYGGLTSVADIDDRLGIRALGAVPLARAVDAARPDALTAIHDQPNGGLAEAVRGILSSIRQAPQGRAQVIAISSALPGEGKTTLALCMARIAAGDGLRVLIIDGDPVQRGLSRAVSSAMGGAGLREVIVDGADPETAIRADSAIATLGLLPITTPFARGERLTGNGRLHRTLAIMRERYDLILIDCPPLLPVADGREVAALADTVALVVKWRTTRDTTLRAALKLLPLRQIDDIGGVLNLVDIRKGARFGGSDPTFLYRRYRTYYGAR